MEPHCIIKASDGGNKMNVLIVYAHPEGKSFNAAMKNVAKEALTDTTIKV